MSSFGGRNKSKKGEWGQGATERLDRFQEKENNEKTEIVSELSNLIKDTKDLVNQITNQERGIFKSKRRVLFNIYKIYTDHVSELPPRHQRNIKAFISETFEIQADQTNGHDAKMIEMLVNHSMGEILDMNVHGMLSSLKQLAYIPQKLIDEGTAFQTQKNLLKRLGNEKLSPTQVKDEITNFKKRNKTSLKVINEIPKEWEVRAPRTGSKIELKGFQNADHQKDMLKLLKEINSDNLQEFMKFSETLKNERT